MILTTSAQPCDQTEISRSLICRQPRSNTTPTINQVSWMFVHLLRQSYFFVNVIHELTLKFKILLGLLLLIMNEIYVHTKSHYSDFKD